MKLIMLSTIVTIYLVNANVRENNMINRNIFELYTDNFNNYLYIDEECKPQIDVGKLEYDLNEKGHKVEVKKEGDSVIIYINEQVYEFYVGENNG